MQVEYLHKQAERVTNGYLNIELTAKYGNQIMSIIEKMTNSEVGVLIKVDEENSIRLSKDQYVDVCKKLVDD